jgi:hypothetical protein
MANRSAELGPIRPDEVYALEDFERRVGLGRGAIREARRQGLRVQYLHGRCYVRGSDWVAYCDDRGKGVKDA